MQQIIRHWCPTTWTSSRSRSQVLSLSLCTKVPSTKPTFTNSPHKKSTDGPTMSTDGRDARVGLPCFLTVVGKTGHIRVILTAPIKPSMVWGTEKHALVANELAFHFHMGIFWLHFSKVMINLIGISLLPLWVSNIFSKNWKNINRGKTKTRKIN